MIRILKAVWHWGLKWCLRKPRPLKEPATTSPPERKPDWFYPQSADVLLSTPLRQQLMCIIRQRTSMSQELFEQLYEAPVARFAELVQHLPASEYHHHAYPGGLLDHTLEVMAFAAKLRQRHLIPMGAAPEDQGREAEAWTAGILYAALLHDIGKIVVDIDVVTEDGHPWHPWLGPPDKPYRLKYRKKRDYRLHPVAGCLMVSRILPDKALNWLATFPQLHADFLHCISGHYDRAGVMAEVVQSADQASVAQFMGAKASTVVQQAPPSLATQMLMALRELVRTRYKLSNPRSGSDGWLTGEALWLVSKTTADNIRAWLLQQALIRVPDDNIRLFDEMQSHNLIIPTPTEKAVWTCEINSDEGWTPGIPMTLLRFSPELIWNDPDTRPPLFAGRVIPLLKEDAPGATEVAQPVMSTNDMTDMALSLFTGNGDAGQDEPTGNTPETPPAGAPFSASPVDAPEKKQRATGVLRSVSTMNGGDFLSWLKAGILRREILVNDTEAPVHMVDGCAFLVSPGIFQLFVKSTTGETGGEWLQVQKKFQRLGLHHRDKSGVNIQTCKVVGARRASRLQGYLIVKPETIFGDAVPEDNPFLSVAFEEGG